MPKPTSDFVVSSLPTRSGIQENIRYYSRKLSHSIANASKKYSKVCVLVNNFCVQLKDKSGLALRTTSRLSIALRHRACRPVVKDRDKVLVLPVVSHSQSPAFFAQITDMLNNLSTLSTPPITTTTNIFI